MKLKVGSLAFIKRAIRQENIGKIVTCTKYLGFYSRGDTITISGESWTIIDTGEYWLVEGNIETMYGTAAQSHIPAHWLSPIDPLPPEQVNEVDTIITGEFEVVD